MTNQFRNPLLRKEPAQPGPDMDDLELRRKNALDTLKSLAQHSESQVAELEAMFRKNNDH